MDSEYAEVFILFIKRRNISPHQPHNRFVFELKFSKLTGGGEDRGRPGKKAGLPTQKGTFSRRNPHTHTCLFSGLLAYFPY